MTGHPEHDDIQRDLAALLAEVEPSAGFAAGVRARIAADEHARQRAWMSWAIPVTAVIAIGFVSWTFVSRKNSSPAPAPAATARIASAEAGVASPAVTPFVATPRTASAARPTSVPAVIQISATPEPRVLVADDQMTALVHYLDRLNAGGAPVPPAIGPQYDADGLLLQPAPVVITPLPALVARPDDDKNTRPDSKSSGKDQ